MDVKSRRESSIDTYHKWKKLLKIVMQNNILCYLYHTFVLLFRSFVKLKVSIEPQVRINCIFTNSHNLYHLFRTLYSVFMDHTNTAHNIGGSCDTIGRHCCSNSAALIYRQQLLIIGKMNQFMFFFAVTHIILFVWITKEFEPAWEYIFAKQLYQIKQKSSNILRRNLI